MKLNRFDCIDSSNDKDDTCATTTTMSSDNDNNSLVVLSSELKLPCFLGNRFREDAGCPK